MSYLLDNAVCKVNMFVFSPTENKLNVLMNEENISSG